MPGSWGGLAVALFWIGSFRDAVLICLTDRRRKSGGSLSLWVGSVLQDLRYSIRSLLREPVFTGMTLLALVVGIGFATSLFAALDATLFRAWDVPNSDRIVRVLSRHPRFDYGGLPIASVRWFERHAGSIEGAFAQRSYATVLDDPPDGQAVQMALVSDGYFGVIGVDLAAGRAFAAGEDDPLSPSAVAVISHGLWKSRFAGDPAVVGTTLRIDDVPFTVIGVAPESFAGTGGSPDLWAPLSVTMVLGHAYALSRLTDPEYCCSDVYARLSPGITRQEAQAELSAMFRQFSTGAAREKIGVAVIGTAVSHHPEERERTARILALSAAAFGSILLLACANVSNMLLARGTARQRELTVRLAIGAGRRRLVRQLLTESVVLAALAGVASVILAPFLLTLAMRSAGQEIPAHLDLAPDGSALAFAGAVTLLSAVVFGFAPALRSTRASVVQGMNAQSVRATARFPLQGAMIAVQVAVSVALLMSTGLLLRGLDRARSLDLGFRTDDVTALTVQLPRSRYEPQRERAFFDELLPRLEAVGGRVGMTSLMPLGDAMNFTDFEVPGASSEASSSMAVQDATPGYFEALDIPVVAGRNFRPGDREAGAILINESLARLHWPDQGPIGRSVTIGGDTRVIVGVVTDARLHAVGSIGPMYFAPFAANSQGVGVPSVVLVPSASARRAAEIIRVAEPGAIIDATPLSEQVEWSLQDSKGATTRLAALLAWVAILLATSGVYGVISYSVEQRRREIGTRIALGARPREVVGSVIRRNATPLWFGALLGIAAAVAASRLVGSHLYGLPPLDPVAFAGVAAALLLGGAAASAIPARRAARVDPMVALRD